MSWEWSYEFEHDTLGTVHYSTSTEEWTVNGKVEGRMSRELANAITDMLDTEGCPATVVGFESTVPKRSGA